MDLSREMGEVKTAVENLKESNDKAHADMQKSSEDGFERVEKRQDISNTRLSALEEWKQRAIGAGVLLGLTLPLFALPVREAIGALFE